MENDLEVYCVLWHDARWWICINVLKRNLYLFTKLHGVTSYKRAMSYPAMIIPYLTFAKSVSVIFSAFLTIALYLWKVSSLMTVHRLHVGFPKIIVRPRVLSRNTPCIQGSTHCYLDMQRSRLISRCRYLPQYTRFSQLMKNVFRDMKPCSVVHMYKTVRGSCCLHHQCRL
jgi:hypothetical protein